MVNPLYGLGIAVVSKGYSRDKEVVGMEGFEDTKAIYENEEDMVCDYCKEKLDKEDEYHMRFGTCNQECYMHNVGMSWSDFA